MLDKLHAQSRLKWNHVYMLYVLTVLLIMQEYFSNFYYITPLLTQDKPEVISK